MVEGPLGLLERGDSLNGQHRKAVDEGFNRAEVRLDGRLHIHENSNGTKKILVDGPMGVTSVKTRIVRAQIRGKSDLGR
jgi:hypothetical protein